ncbi:unnamed protein product, partial [Ectocarpus sp. 13 AM-2016]
MLFAVCCLLFTVSCCRCPLSATLLLGLSLAMETPRDEVQKACVLGSGAFGTALAQLMARKGVPT